jgi:hypothetical protein
MTNDKLEVRIHRVGTIAGALFKGLSDHQEATGAPLAVGEVVDAIVSVLSFHVALLNEAKDRADLYIAIGEGLALGIDKAVEQTRQEATLQ